MVRATCIRFPQWNFNVYFVAQIDPVKVPSDPQQQWDLCMNLPGCIELTWNYGSETEEGNVYNTGNSDATGSQDGQQVKGGFGCVQASFPRLVHAVDRHMR